MTIPINIHYIPDIFINTILKLRDPESDTVYDLLYKRVFIRFLMLCLKIGGSLTRA